MAKKKEKVEPQFALDYLQIVDSLNDEAFAFCVDTIFPVLGYRVLRKEEVRRVDLKERLREFSAQSGSLYLHILRWIAGGKIVSSRVGFDAGCFQKPKRFWETG